MYINEIITVSSICTGNITQGLSTDWSCEVGAMIDNTPGRDWKNSYFCIYCPDMLKDYQKEIKLFEFSQDRKREYWK